MATNDFAAASRLLSPDYRGYWPQSRELIEGRENFIRVNADYPAEGRWRFTLRQLVAGDPDVVTEVDVTDGVMQATVVTFHRVERGEIVHQLEYWPDPFDAPPWRAPFVRLSDRPESMGGAAGEPL
ncbi:nuclear transport factor 2 family protein [Pontivivens ytuae]|nr:nuclear transport factor 2 family protein [Pontivivens ytuae]